MASYRRLRWLNVHLADPEGAYLRVAETWVRYGTDTPKSQAGERTIALGQRVAAELFEHRARTDFRGDDERVFCSPTRGSAFDVQRYTETFRKALTKAGITDYVRPFHDLRHSSITNAAAAGTPPAALMARAGHSSFTTTQGYIDLAGETFREEADPPRTTLVGRDQYQKPVPKGRFVARDGNAADTGAGRRNRVSAGTFVGYGAAQESNLPSLGLPDLTGFEDRLRHRPRAAPGGRVAPLLQHARDS